MDGNAPILPENPIPRHLREAVLTAFYAGRRAVHDLDMNILLRRFALLGLVSTIGAMGVTVWVQRATDNGAVGLLWALGLAAGGLLCVACLGALRAKRPGLKAAVDEQKAILAGVGYRLVKRDDTVLLAKLDEPDDTAFEPWPL